MIAIVNVTPEGITGRGVNQYELYINDRIICKFEHYRETGGLAQCLRDAANAVEIAEIKKLAWLAKEFESTGK